ncbi:MAG: MFS transporter permease [Micromonosporaceae bacterium]|nr:MFS transporter permease [Micromonosporaceae bacterium]
MARWLTAPVPLGRLAAFRTLVYLFVIGDLLHFTSWVRGHADLPGELYRPLLVGRLLPFPTPTPALVYGVFAALLLAAAVAATGRLPRLAGGAVALLYLQWMLIAMSYGKVDHDRFGLLVALAVLATVGRARHGDPTRSEAAGWALRATQLAVVATYFLASWAKLRYGGLDWITSATLTWAIIRRGTVLGDALLGAPWLLIAGQAGIVAFELLSPLLFVLRERWRYAAVGFLYSFHLVSFAAITISFLPHLVAMTSFLPLERVRPVEWVRRWWRRRRSGGAGQRAGGGAAGQPVPVPGDPPVRGPGERAHRADPQ